MAPLYRFLEFVLKIIIVFDFSTIKVKNNGIGYVVDHYIYLKVATNKDGTIRCRCQYGNRQKCTATGTIKNEKFEVRGNHNHPPPNLLGYFRNNYISSNDKNYI